MGSVTQLNYTSLTTTDNNSTNQNKTNNTSNNSHTTFISNGIHDTNTSKRTSSDPIDVQHYIRSSNTAVPGLNDTDTEEPPKSKKLKLSTDTASNKVSTTKKSNSTCHICEHSRHKLGNIALTTYVHCSNTECNKSYCRRPGCLKKLLKFLHISDFAGFGEWYDNVINNRIQWSCPHCVDKEQCIGNGCIVKYQKANVNNNKSKDQRLTAQYTTGPTVPIQHNNVPIMSYQSIYPYTTYSNNVYPVPYTMAQYSNQTTDKSNSMHMPNVQHPSIAYQPTSYIQPPTHSAQLYEQFNQYITNNQLSYPGLQLYDASNRTDTTAPYGWLNSTVPMEQRVATGLTIPNSQPVTINVPIVSQLNKALETEVIRRMNEQHAIPAYTVNNKIMDPVPYSNIHQSNSMPTGTPQYTNKNNHTNNTLYQHRQQ